MSHQKSPCKYPRQNLETYKGLLAVPPCCYLHITMQTLSTDFEIILQQQSSFLRLESVVVNRSPVPTQLVYCGRLLIQMDKRFHTILKRDC